MSKNRILASISKAINTYGGTASLSEIYNYILNHPDEIDLSKYTDPKSVIRKTIYLHSSDCDIFNGENGNSNDIFYAVQKKGKGLWGIRKNNNTSKKTLSNNVYLEGNVNLYSYSKRERNTSLIKEAKEVFKFNNDGQLHCEVCNFNFQKSYGNLGEDFIEGHHVIPISSFNEEHEVRIEDIKLVCSNCHSMLHRKDPPFTIDELKDIIVKNEEQ